MSKNKLIILDEQSNIFTVNATDQNYEKYSIIDVPGYEGRFIVANNSIGNITVWKIPFNVNEEEYRSKFILQSEKAIPVNRRRGI